MTAASSPPRTELAGEHGVRDWWLRTLLIVQHPRAVFVALRDDTTEAVSDRTEQILAIVILAGIAVVLTTSTAAHLSDDQGPTGIVIPIWAFLFGLIYGAFGYFVVGALLYFAVKALGSRGSYRRSRHVLAFAAVPLALSLVLWPVKLALYGSDWFQTGGRDTGLGGGIFDLLTYAFFVWALVLLVLGIRSVHGWTWGRALAAAGIALTLPLAFVLIVYSL
jgi:hypothetical protein